MSVKVKLNNKTLFASPFLIGSRLYEADETTNQTQASTNNTTGNAAGNQPAQQTTQPAQPTQQTQTPQQQPTMAQQVSQIINTGFATLAKNIAYEVAKIQGPQWPAYPQQQATAQETLQAVQKYIGDVINVVKSAQQQAQQTTNTNNQ